MAAPSPLSAAAVRLPLFLVLWIVLTEGHGEIVMPGLPLAALATAASIAVLPPARRWRLGVRLLALVPRLLIQSMRSGWDVAIRALRPSLPIDPAFVEIQLRRPDPVMATMVAYLMTLLPGSLAAEVARGSMRFHVLDQSQPVEAAAARLERDLEGQG